VQVTGPGASTILVHPRPGPLSWLRGTVPTIHGGVTVSIDRRQQPRIELELPPNTETRLELVGAEVGADRRKRYVRSAPGSPASP
jgi:hypothetical protein